MTSAVSGLLPVVRTIIMLIITRSPVGFAYRGHEEDWREPDVKV